MFSRCADVMHSAVLWIVRSIRLHPLRAKWTTGWRRLSGTGVPPLRSCWRGISSVSGPRASSVPQSQP